MAQGLATHASARQSAVARNIANADTPGYRARDVASFAESYDDTRALQRYAGHESRASGCGTVDCQRLSEVSRRQRQASPNGNTVSLETEMMKATEVRHQHDLALSVYSTSLNILRTSLGRGR